jgi:hypothetical protein
VLQVQVDALPLLVLAGSGQSLSFHQIWRAPRESPTQQRESTQRRRQKKLEARLAAQAAEGEERRQA